jgi:hypothetical protein
MVQHIQSTVMVLTLGNGNGNGNGKGNGSNRSCIMLSPRFIAHCLVNSFPISSVWQSQCLCHFVLYRLVCNCTKIRLLVALPFRLEHRSAMTTVFNVRRATPGTGKGKHGCARFLEPGRRTFSVKGSAKASRTLQPSITIPQGHQVSTRLTLISQPSHTT